LKHDLKIKEASKNLTAAKKPMPKICRVLPLQPSPIRSSNPGRLTDNIMMFVCGMAADFIDGESGRVGYCQIHRCRIFDMKKSYPWWDRLLQPWPGIELDEIGASLGGKLRACVLYAIRCGAYDGCVGVCRHSFDYAVIEGEMRRSEAFEGMPHALR
jgi:hypothetical protein